MMQTKSLLNLSLAVVMLTGLSACQSSDDSDDNDYDGNNVKKENINNNHHVRIITYAKPI